ncbi:MAG: 2-hydroxyacyl-CoA dehydratase family protein [Campylobacterales bacterium]|nr:2-hydroxyacyl-CoA dehydratase family protein [Campylobacterales bacterium]
MLNACGYTQSADFIYGETTCEAKKKTWEILDKRHPVHVMQIPHKKDKKSMELWGSEIMDFKTHIEEVTKQPLSTEQLRQGIDIVIKKEKLYVG